MNNATIATSRPRRGATPAPLDYRPLPAEWGDVESLRALRSLKAHVAEQGGDPSLVTLDAEEYRAARRPQRGGLLGRLRRDRGIHRGPRPQGPHWLAA